MQFSAIQFSQLVSAAAVANGKDKEETTKYDSKANRNRQSFFVQKALEVEDQKMKAAAKSFLA